MKEMLVYKGYVYKEAYTQEDAVWETIGEILKDLTKIAVVDDPMWPNNKKRQSFAERYKALRDQLSFIGLGGPMV